jgi:hypothetical protein
MERLKEYFFQAQNKKHACICDDILFVIEAEAETKKWTFCKQQRTRLLNKMLNVGTLKRQ